MFRAIIIAGMLAFITPVVAADDAVHPSRVTGEQLAGPIFEDLPFVMDKQADDNGPFEAKDIVLYESPDGRYFHGVYELPPVEFTIDLPYGVDETMFFAKGGVTLTSADGVKTVVGPGDAVTISRNWKGHWSSPDGYRKIYVIHEPSDQTPE